MSLVGVSEYRVSFQVFADLVNSDILYEDIYCPDQLKVVRSSALADKSCIRASHGISIWALKGTHDAKEIN